MRVRRRPARGHGNLQSLGPEAVPNDLGRKHDDHPRRRAAGGIIPAMKYINILFAVLLAAFVAVTVTPIYAQDPAPAPADPAPAPADPAPAPAVEEPADDDAAEPVAEEVTEPEADPASDAANAESDAAEQPADDADDADDADNAQDAPADDDAAPEPEVAPEVDATLADRIAAVHSDLMGVVNTYEGGAGAEATAQDRVDRALAELEQAQQAFDAVQADRADARDALIAQLNSIVAMAGDLIAELTAAQ